MRAYLELSGCGNGIPNVVTSKGHLGKKVGPGSRLELVADMLALQWGIALVLPCYLDLILFVLARMPVLAGDHGAAERRADEPVRREAHAMTDWVLVDDVGLEFSRARIVHSMDVQPRSASLVSGFRHASLELEAGEHAMALSTERAALTSPRRA